MHYGSHRSERIRSKPFCAVVLFVAKNGRAQTTPSPPWKDRSGRKPGTALSLTSSRSILRLPSKTQDPWLWASGFLRVQVVRRAATWVMPQNSKRLSVSITSIPSLLRVCGATRLVPEPPGLPVTKASASAGTHLLRRYEPPPLLQVIRRL